MIINGKDITTPQNAEVCVIGSGPAGITAAWELSQAGMDVILLDGGRQLNYSQAGYYTRSWPDKIKLYAGTTQGEFSSIYEANPTFLTRPYTGARNPSERERVFGGTSTHWGGQSRPLDSIAFEKRDGMTPDGKKIPNAFPGWPITRQELDPYYAQAVTFNHLFGAYFDQGGNNGGGNFTPEFWASEMQKQGLEAAVPHLDRFNAEMYQFMGDKWKNFATRPFETRIGNSAAVRVIVNATLLDMVEQGGSVKHLKVASLKDDYPERPMEPKELQKATEFTVTADVYILACGAVANARQLLLTDFGKRNDLVGRYFMCHPLTQNQVVTTTQNYLSPAQQNLMNGNGWTDPRGDDGIGGITGRFTIDGTTARDEGIGCCWFWPNGGSMYFEMAPNYHSCVTLDKTQKDVFDRDLTCVNWHFTDVDQWTYQRNCSLFNEAARFNEDPYKFPSIISWDPWDQIKNEWTINGHHIGTTRMSASAADGVVDQNLKFHGVDNLYVAGSSVFPTAGISNPTMTIITLSIRLAEHLRAQMPRARAAKVQ